MAKKRLGSQRMVDLGYKNSVVWLSPEDYWLLHQAATLEGRYLANFIKMSAVNAARKLLRERKQQPPKID